MLSICADISETVHVRFIKTYYLKNTLMVSGAVFLTRLIQSAIQRASKITGRAVWTVFALISTLYLLKDPEKK
jgi:hypothetical protein